MCSVPVGPTRWLQAFDGAVRGNENPLSVALTRLTYLFLREWTSRIFSARPRHGFVIGNRRSQMFSPACRNCSGTNKPATILVQVTAGNPVFRHPLSAIGCFRSPTSQAAGKWEPPGGRGRSPILSRQLAPHAAGEPKVPETRQPCGPQTHPGPQITQEPPSSTFFTNPLALPAGVWYKQ